MELDETARAKLAEIRTILEREEGEPTAEAEDLTLSGDFVPLVEKAVGANGTMAVKIIAPGQGSSGYYPAEVLERDGPGVFKAGTKMYVDHPTTTEEAERPERSLRDLAAELVSDARYESAGVAGPGLYAEAKVFDPWKPFVEELAPHIGVSINAMGKYRVGEVAGQKTPIIDAIVAAKSVDFVTTPGAGGQILSLYEAARSRVVEPQPHSGGEDVDETKLREAEAARDTALAEAQAAKERAEALEAENARLKEAELLDQATTVAGQIVNAAEALHEITRKRLVNEAVKSLPMKDGTLDVDALKEAAQALTDAAVAEHAAITESGKVKGMGGASADADSGQLQESWKAKYRSEGYDEATAEQLAAIASGR
jgi:hypothetical protein